MTGGPDLQPNVDDPNFWEMCYQQGTTPWEYGAYAPPLKTFLDSPYRMPPGKMAVLGCGTGHDCLLMLQYGYEVTGIDFAPSAIRSTHQKFLQTGLAGTKAYLLQRDIFDLHVSEYKGYFDYVLEHTCFCSIFPANRKRYFYTVRDLLKPGGKFLALWFVGDRVGGGLPYSASKNEIFDLFNEAFSLDITYDPADSFPNDQGREMLTLMTKL
jgi:SAM-dependent methyltransferase